MKKKKSWLTIYFVLIVAAVLCLQLVLSFGSVEEIPPIDAAVSISGFSGGTGTSTNPYLISDVSDLNTLANHVNSGKSTANTYFKGYRRYLNHTPSLICPNASNDLFTVSNEDGNQALTYPIGLITVDELMLGGLADGYLNRLSYTYSSTYWTMSPSAFDVTSVAAHELVAYSAGYAGHGSVTSALGVRAVINLKADTPITKGIGTANDPFVVG